MNEPRQANDGDLAHVIDPRLKFPRVILRSVHKLARAKPWQGSFDRRFRLIADCLTELSGASESCATWQLVHTGSRTGCSSGSKLIPKLQRVNLTGRLSVVTMLHLYASRL